MSLFEILSLIIGALTAIGTVGAVFITLVKLRKDKQFTLKILADEHAINSNHEIEIINNDTKSVLLKQIGIRVQSEWIPINSIIFYDHITSLPLTIEPNQYIALDNVIGLMIDTILSKVKQIPKRYFHIELYFGINQKKSITRLFSGKELRKYYHSRIISRKKIKNAIQKLNNEDDVCVFRNSSNGVYMWKTSRVIQHNIFVDYKQSLAQSTFTQYVVVDKYGHKKIYDLIGNDEILEMDKKPGRISSDKSIPQDEIVFSIPKHSNVGKFWRIKYWFRTRKKIPKMTKKRKRKKI